ncbi:uncharacterized protein BT62DRAFT_1012017 [Guyanagaster necrorhizus]|uniref:Uncharacterized protein n=1 Tax=Guyanagaster necrorhizus TaxID=856835 RepID=A0A9P7VIK6_9AGAR|nr:uncharacterized protein BT62DRAFT_1012017 [Guyanagaster necrorhizus MCA 3950]KAG7441205.1 hypothetical protein BT62DRAFT_1012017 [Guyanagaster necrorhizus MCA 3950]
MHYNGAMKKLTGVNVCSVVSSTVEMDAYFGFESCRRMAYCSFFSVINMKDTTTACMKRPAVRERGAEKVWVKVKREPSGMVQLSYVLLMVHACRTSCWKEKAIRRDIEVITKITGQALTERCHSVSLLTSQERGRQAYLARCCRLHLNLTSRTAYVQMPDVDITVKARRSIPQICHPHPKPPSPFYSPLAVFHSQDKRCAGGVILTAEPATGVTESYKLRKDETQFVKISLRKGPKNSEFLKGLDLFLRTNMELRCHFLLSGRAVCYIPQHLSKPSDARACPLFAFHRQSVAFCIQGHAQEWSVRNSLPFSQFVQYFQYVATCRLPTDGETGWRCVIVILLPSFHISTRILKLPRNSSAPGSPNTSHCYCYRAEHYGMAHESRLDLNPDV